MANFRLPEHLRLHLEAVNSPTTFPGMQQELGLSPVTDLAFNLSGTSLGSTPRRKLSLSSIDNTPTPTKIKIKQGDLSDADLSTPEHRLFKNNIKLSNSNAGLTRSRGFPHRINVNLAASPQIYDKSSSSQNDKENMGCVGNGSLTGVSQTDVTPFPQHSSPTKQITASSSKFYASKQSPLRQRQPLEDQDPNSQDSGYGAFIDKEESKSGFHFAEPNALPPRKFHIEQSPRKENSPAKSSWNKTSGHSNSSLVHSLSSGSESIDDGFTDLLDLEKAEESSNLPSGINSLLSGTIIRGHSSHNIVPTQNTSPKEERSKPVLQRSNSLVENVTPASSRARSRLFKSPSSSDASVQDENSGLVELDPLRSFKRPEPPCELGPAQPKRRKSCSLHSIRENALSSPSLQRSFSETEATIKKALLRSTQIPDLIGDFSKSFILPLMDGRHQDLKTISADTLASLMNGDFKEVVESYTIVDCRYPYEYEGGHIKGAKNVYTKEQILKEFVEKPVESSNTNDSAQEKESSETKRNILIFHCEFSSERGPSLFRFLRNSDRDQNKETYPSLKYPELYLLHGGYKTFFERHSDKCEPCAYKPMLDPNHETDLRLFRSKSKSWNGDNKSRLALRSNLKRLGL